jgi:hypothetical protein
MRITAETGGLKIDYITFTKIKDKEDCDNLLKNPGFEQGTLNWTPKSCVFSTVNSPVHSGNVALFVSDRQAAWASPQQNIKADLLQKGPGIYIASAFVKAINDTGVTAKVTVRLRFGGENYYFGTTAKTDTARWIHVSGKLTLTWSGNLEEAFFYVETINQYSGDYYLDDVFLSLDSAFTPIKTENKKIQFTGQIQLTNWPNPFNPATTISFNIPTTATTSLIIYDMNGREVKSLLKEELSPGQYTISWNGWDKNNNLASSGIFFACLKMNNILLTRKLLLIH